MRQDNRLKLIYRFGMNGRKIMRLMQDKRLEFHGSLFHIKMLYLMNLCAISLYYGNVG
jgi:hypothetical protein